MAAVGEEEVEYESDPEEAKRSLAMRRREASDDEEGNGDGEDDKPRMDRRATIHSDESDGQGAAADYDDEELDMEDEDYEEIYDEEEEEEEEDENDEEEVDEGKEGMERNDERASAGGAEATMVAATREPEGDGIRSLKESVDGRVGNNVAEESEKKENEPFAVPTAGAFYMHDDRFRDNAGGRHRRTHGGRKLWESKDDRKWGHDKFEEMSLQERQYEEGRRSSRGRYRARGKNRGPDHGYPRGNRSKAFNGNNNHNQPPKGSVRGRGPRRYEHATKNSGQSLPTHNKQFGKALEKISQTSSARAFTPTTNAESVPIPPTKQVFASNLSSASPPFYPSGSSNKDVTLTQKRDMQAGSIPRSLRTSAIDENLSAPQTNALVRGKNIVDSVSMDKLYIDDFSTSAAGKTLTNLQMSTSGSSMTNTTQFSQSRSQGRGATIAGQMSYQPAAPPNQVNRVTASAQLNTVQRGPVQNRIQQSSQSSGQQTGHRPVSGSQSSSPPKTALSVNSYEAGEVESSSETGKSKGALVGKGKGSIQGSGRGSFLYSGAQVIGATGNVAVGHSDQNFPGTPAFLPVMQFGGQHPGGLGVPAVGMAFPGYVAQPHGLGNSEMTWLPVLAGAAGALGATYCSPYIAVDGSYNARPSGQTSSVGSSSKENNTNKSNNEWKPSQRPELVSDEFGQRQNNPNKQPRRYSEMSFSK